MPLAEKPKNLGIEWDAENRLIAINQGTQRSEFSYNGVGYRVGLVEKQNAVTTTESKLLWCGIELCEQRDAPSLVVTHRFFRLGMAENGTTYFFSRDHLGSVRELTGADATLWARYEYDSYGDSTRVAGTESSPLGYSGHFEHAQTGLVLAPFRAYDSLLGRWLSEDPSGLVGGLNRYDYVRNSPLNHVDPTGMVRMRVDGPNYWPAGDWRETQLVCRPGDYGCTRTRITQFDCQCTKECDGWRAKVEMAFQIDVYYMSDSLVPIGEIIFEENKHVSAAQSAISRAKEAAENLEQQRFSTKAFCQLGCFSLAAKVTVDLAFDWVHWKDPHPKKFRGLLPF